MMLRPPLPALFDRPHRGRLLAALAVATLLVGATALPALGTLSDRGAGIIEFELAASSSHAEEIVSEWGEEGRDAATESLILDYPYLVLYGLLLAGACSAVSARADRAGKPRLARAGVLFAWGGLGAAAADALENVGLLVVAAGHTDQPWPGLAAAFAVAKFALSISAGVYAVLGWALTRGGPRAAA
jgi:hypothetical protein